MRGREGKTGISWYPTTWKVVVSGWRRERGLRRAQQQAGTLLFPFGFFCSFLVVVFSLNAFLAFSQLLAQEFMKFIGSVFGVSPPPELLRKRHVATCGQTPHLGVPSTAPLRQRVCSYTFLPSAVGLEQGSAATFFFIVELASLCLRPLYFHLVVSCLRVSTCTAPPLLSPPLKGVAQQRVSTSSLSRASTAHLLLLVSSSTF